jgi:hypothetical protein
VLEAWREIFSEGVGEGMEKYAREEATRSIVTFRSGDVVVVGEVVVFIVGGVGCDATQQMC